MVPATMAAVSTPADNPVAADWRDRLRGAGWLLGARLALVERFLDHCVLRKFEEGDVIFAQGALSGELFGVVDGQVAASRHGEGNDDVDLMHIFRTGEWFGYAPVLEGRPRRIQATARRVTRVAMVPDGRLRSVLANDPVLWELIAWLSDAQGRMLALGSLDLCRKSQRERLIATLLRLAGCRTTDAPDGPPHDIAASQAELAEMSNMSRNVVSRLLQDFEKRGWIELKYRHLYLLDPGAMRNLLEV